MEPKNTNVRCKMLCTYKDDGESGQVKFEAVMDESNKTWSKYTPCGSISLGINNESAFAQFEKGKTYFVAFTEAPATEAEEK